MSEEILINLPFLEVFREQFEFVQTLAATRIFLRLTCTCEMKIACLAHGYFVDTGAPHSIIHPPDGRNSQAVGLHSHFLRGYVPPYATWTMLTRLVLVHSGICSKKMLCKKTTYPSFLHPATGDTHPPSFALYVLYSGRDNLTMIAPSLMSNIYLYPATSRYQSTRPGSVLPHDIFKRMLL